MEVVVSVKGHASANLLASLCVDTLIRDDDDAGGFFFIIRTFTQTRDLSVTLRDHDISRETMLLRVR